MRAAVNPKVRRIWAAEGSQVSKSEGLFNIIGHKFDTDPAPMLYVGPTKSNVSSVIEPRIAKMIRECASLRAKTKVGRRSKLIKEIGDICLRLAWAGSPTELASEPIHTVLLDEIDRMKAIKGEGNPVFIAEARISTYPDGRLIGASSPTAGTVETEKHPDTGIEHWKVAKPEDVQSQIWLLWQEGTRFEWAMPCLDCGKFFVPRFKLLKWADKATPREAQKTARLACPHCGALHEEATKSRMNAGATFLAPGQMVVGYDPSKPGAPTHRDLQTGDGNGEVVGALEDTEVYSFWVSGLCSPWITYGQRAASYVRAVRSGDQERVRAIINTGFGELYAIKGDAPKPEDIRESLSAPYRYGSVPRGVQRIYVTVDVQKRQLPFVIRGWGYGYESWLIEAGELYGIGDTDQPDVWDRLTKLCMRALDGMPVNAVAVDSGFRTDVVYDWCYQNGKAAFATKGMDAPRKIYNKSEIEFSRVGSKAIASVDLWTFADKHFKAWVHGRLNRPQDAPDAFHIPEGDWDYADEYCRQLVAEQQLRLASGRTIWIGGSKQHDFLDCEAMQAFLAHACGVRDLQPLDAPAPVVHRPAPRKPVVRSSGVSIY
jgi:phage terminase large subunit GpA-like protein